MNAVRALLVTDLVDSTAIAHRIGDAATAALWVEHDRLARDLLQHWRGREIDRSDGFFLLFDRSVDALGYVMAWHQALAQMGHDRLARFKLELASRAGLHVGDVTLRANPPEDVARGAKPLEADGLAKAVAARVMSLARGGQTLLTAAAHEALLGEQPGTLPRLRSHGRWKLKGIADPLELFEAGSAETVFAPPADSDKVHRVVWRDGRWLPAREVGHSLPAEPDSFVGRGDALRALGESFDGGARRARHGRQRQDAAGAALRLALAR
jgi:class 3 adenylate cyclase